MRPVPAFDWIGHHADLSPDAVAPVVDEPSGGTVRSDALECAIAVLHGDGGRAGDEPVTGRVPEGDGGPAARTEVEGGLNRDEVQGVLNRRTPSIDREPRVKPSHLEVGLRSDHPFFWGGYLLVDTGARPHIEDSTADAVASDSGSEP